MQATLEGGAPAEANDFSVILGGPLYQLLLRSGLLRPPMDLGAAARRRHRTVDLDADAPPRAGGGARVLRSLSPLLPGPAGAGPTAVVIREQGGWTFSLLTGQAWSFAGDSLRSRVSAAVVQPSVSFTTRRDTSFGRDTASLDDWTAGEWTVPLELSLAQLVKIGKQPASVGLTARYGLRHPADGPSRGLVLTMTLLFPH